MRFGIYRMGRARATLAVVMLDEEAACSQARTMARAYGQGFLVAECADEIPDAIRYGTRTGPKVIYRVSPKEA